MLVQAEKARLSWQSIGKAEFGVNAIFIRLGEEVHIIHVSNDTLGITLTDHQIVPKRQRTVIQQDFSAYSPPPGSLVQEVAVLFCVQHDPFCSIIDRNDKWLEFDRWNSYFTISPHPRSSI